MSETSAKLSAWWDRVKAIRFLNERELFVTPAEFDEMRRDFEVADEETPPEVREARRMRALLDGQLDYFLGTPVVVDDEQARQQRERILAAGSVGAQEEPRA